MTATPAETITVSWKDVWEGRAYIRLSGAARVKLAHLAGAPWNDKDPKAKLHALQVEVLHHEEREKIVHGASRLGKSVLGGCEAIAEVILPYRRKLAVVAARYDHVAHEWQYLDRGLKTLFADRGQAFKRISFRHSPNYHDYEVETAWGTTARGYSTESDEGASLLGQEFSRMILGEGSHISTEILQKRALRGLDGWLMQRSDGITREGGGYLSIYTTPKGYEGCSASEWERIQRATNRRPERLHYGRVPFAESVWVREASILENPAYSRAVYEARKKSIDKNAFQEQYEGKMTFRTGRVLRSYDEDAHRVARPPVNAIRAMRLGVGIDTGAYTGFILGGIDPAAKLWALGETYTEQLPISQALDQFRDMVVEVLGPVYGTTAFDQLKHVIDVWSIDPASQHKLEIMEMVGDITLTHPVGFEGGKAELIPTLDLLDDWFRHGRAHLCDDLDVLNDQIRKYVWKQRKAATNNKASVPVVIEPRKEYDHLIDALRFLWLVLEPMGALEEAPPAVTLKEAWKRAQNDRVHGPLRDIMREAKLWEEMNS